MGLCSRTKICESWVVGIVGAGLTTLLKIITTYLITIILPMIQALLLFVIIILLPVLLAFSAFKLDYVIGIFVAMFAISFVTVIIAVISIVDNSLLALMASNAPPGSGGFMQAVHIAGNGDGLEFFLINLLILFFYLIAIKLWFSFIVEFGGKVMNNIGDNMTSVAPLDNFAGKGNNALKGFGSGRR